MAVSIIVDNVAVPVKVIKFSDGGTNIKLEVPEYLVKYPPSTYYSISVEPITPVDNYLWEIVQAVDAIERTFGKVFKREFLYLPYLPHGRADRVFEHGNGFPLKLFLDAVCWMFNEIFLTDPHSDFYKGYEDERNRNQLLNKDFFVVTPQHQCFIEVAGKDIKSGDVLIAPDKGAWNKIYKLQQALDKRMIATFVVEAGKKRDIKTGRVIETTLPDDVDIKGKVAWIVDDIGDGLGTFIPLAEKLKEAGVKQVNLYVTHLIASKGLDILKGKVDTLYAYQVIGNYINRIDIENFNRGAV